MAVSARKRPKRKPARDGLPKGVWGFLARRWYLVALAVIVLVPVVIKYLMGVVAIGIPLLAVWGGLAGMAQSFRQARLIADTPTSTIRAAAQGYVELKAKAPLLEAAPLTGRPASLWKLEISRYVRDAKDQRRLDKSISAWAPSYFLEVEDGIGKCLVSLGDVEMDCMTVTRKPQGDDLQRLSTLFGSNDKTFLARTGEWEIKEEILPPDAPLYLIGRFSTYTSTEMPKDLDWVDAVNRRKGRAGKVAEAIAGSLDGLDEERAAEWEARLRKLEGIGPDDPMPGTVRVNVMTADYQVVPRRPLVVSYRSERRVIFQQYGNLAWAAALVGIGLLFAGYAAGTMYPRAATSVLTWAGAPVPQWIAQKAEGVR